MKILIIRPTRMKFESFLLVFLVHNHKIFLRLRQFVGKTREELCDLIVKTFSVVTINKIHWTLGLSAHVLICCNTLNEKDWLLAQKIATYLVQERKVAVYLKVWLKY